MGDTRVRINSLNLFKKCYRRKLRSPYELFVTAKRTSVVAASVAVLLGLEATVYGQKDERDKQAEIKAKIGTMTKE